MDNRARVSAQARPSRDASPRWAAADRDKRPASPATASVRLQHLCRPANGRSILSNGLKRMTLAPIVAAVDHTEFGAVGAASLVEVRQVRLKNRGAKAIHITKGIAMSKGCAVVFCLSLSALTCGFLRTCSAAPPVADPLDIQLHEFAPPGGGFTAQMPNDTEKRTQTINGAPSTSFVYAERQGILSVSYADIPNGQDESDEQLNARFDNARDAVAAAQKLEIESEASITIGKHAGREVVFTLPQGQGKAIMRMAIVKARLYNVTVLGTYAWCNSPEARVFLDSFTLTR
jgi:hypothetical protein